MDITFTKVSDDEHRIVVTRKDGSVGSAYLPSKDFLRHDFAHYVVESELPIRLGFWGSVAAGASLTGEGAAGKDIALAETLAGPVQTLMRTEAAPAAYLAMLERIQPGLATADLAARLHERARRIAGHWKATPFGGTMQFTWQEADTTRGGN